VTSRLPDIDPADLHLLELPEVVEPGWRIA